MLRFALALAVLASAHAQAADRLASVETRPGTTVEYWRMDRDAARATLILLPGGDGALKLQKNGLPASDNFLVRTRDAFADAGFTVAIMGKPTDRAELDPQFRASAEHVEDIRVLAERLRTELGKPVWLVAT
ncbi:MAG: alpha/beta hydrolase, partial [Burkholderiales bacterium]|nr:alpha/beta hydrolase [Burkholderiales bacterium]